MFADQRLLNILHAFRIHILLSVGTAFAMRFMRNSFLGWSSRRAGSLRGRQCRGREQDNPCKPQHSDSAAIHAHSEYHKKAGTENDL
jgi:hypothetical protein